MLTLQELTEDLGTSYVEMVDEFEGAGEQYVYNNVPLARSDFAAFVRELEDEKQGIGLPPGIVRQTTYVLVRDGGRVLGEFRFRPTVPPPYFNNNGHVGYNVRPSERRKGYASHVLGLLCDKARDLGLEGLMIPIGGENTGSIRTVRKCGGRLARQEIDPASGEVTSWYWIQL
jgi:predicted acetyltransferase